MIKSDELLELTVVCGLSTVDKSQLTVVCGQSSVDDLKIFKHFLAPRYSLPKEHV